MTNSAIVPRRSSRQWWSGAKPGSTSAVGRFLVVTYVVAYAMWALVALAAGDVLALPMVLLAVLFLGGLSPTLAALGMAYLETGTRGVTVLLGLLFRWRVPLVWYAAALIGPALVVFAGIAAGVAVGSPLPPVPSWSAWLSSLALFPVFILLAAIEEVGWRAYALPRMQIRMHPLRASLLLGIAWAFWHAPQWFIPQIGQAAFPFPAFLIWVVALSIQFAWIYNGTGGSVLLVLLAHAATNAFQGPWSAALMTLPEGARGVEPRLLVLVPQVVLSVVIVVLTRGRLGLLVPSTPYVIPRSGRRLGRWAQDEEGQSGLGAVGRQVHAGSPAGNRPCKDDLLRLRVEGIELLHLLSGLPLEGEHPRPAHGHESRFGRGGRGGVGGIPGHRRVPSPAEYAHRMLHGHSFPFLGFVHMTAETRVPEVSFPVNFPRIDSPRALRHTGWRRLGGVVTIRGDRLRGRTPRARDRLVGSRSDCRCRGPGSGGCC